MRDSTFFRAPHNSHPHREYADLGTIHQNVLCAPPQPFHTVPDCTPRGAGVDTDTNLPHSVAGIVTLCALTATIPPTQANGIPQHKCGLAVKCAETLTYRALSIIHSANAAALDTYWNFSGDDAPMLYRMVESMELPFHKRGAVSPVHEHSSVRGCCYGITWGRQKHPYFAQCDQLRSLVAHIKTMLRNDGLHNFTYSTIQINKGLRAKTHVDAANIALSLIITLGPFTGGWTWQLVGSIAAILQTGQWAYIDGRAPHSSSLFCGLRTSIVLFTHSSLTSPATAASVAVARSFGVPLPTAFEAVQLDRATVDHQIDLTNAYLAYADTCTDLVDLADATTAVDCDKHIGINLDTQIGLFLSTVCEAAKLAAEKQEADKNTSRSMIAISGMPLLRSLRESTVASSNMHGSRF